jgi:hypothetical protein
MTRPEAKRRRQELAKAMRIHNNLSAVAIEFGVSEDLVRRACKEFGVESSKSKARHRKEISKRQVAADLRTGKTPASVAKEYHVPVARIVRLQHQMTSGLPVG